MILETERLILREFAISDAHHLFDLNSDPAVLKHTGDPPFSSIGEAKEFIEQYDDYRNNGYGRWAVILKRGNIFIGWCGLKLNEEGFVDLGFRFLRKHWNKGYASESAEAALRYGFDTLGLKEIIGRAAKENTASIRVLEKLEMDLWKQGSCHGIQEVLYYRKFK